MLARGGSRALLPKTGFTWGAKPERRSALCEQSQLNCRYPVPLGRDSWNPGQVRNEAAITLIYGV